MVRETGSEEADSQHDANKAFPLFLFLKDKYSENLWLFRHFGPASGLASSVSPLYIPGEVR